MRYFILWLALVFPVLSNASAPADKKRFNLLNPTPRSMMREFNTDRPDRTEVPYTVDAGHLQVETDLVTYFHDLPAAGEAERRVIFNNMNTKLGLLNDVDLQVVTQSYNIVMEAGARDTGYGDTIVRLKWNLMGNDEGAFALGVMPYLKFPTASPGVGNARHEGGLIVPSEFTLPGNWALGVMLQYDRLSNEDGGNGYYDQLSSSVALGHELLLPELEGYVEFHNSAVLKKGADWLATVDGGLIWALRPDVLLDLGVNAGVTEASTDWNPFVGLSFRY